MKSSVDDKLVIKKKVKQPIVFPQVGGSDIVYNKEESDMEKPADAEKRLVGGALLFRKREDRTLLLKEKID